jgi:hypothetical protein
MKTILTALVCALIAASCATSPGPLLPYDASDFQKRPEVVVIDGHRYLSYQLGGGAKTTQPGIRTRVVGDEVHCFVDIFISANGQTDRPRNDSLPDQGSVFWLNPDGTQTRLDVKDKKQNNRMDRTSQ